MGDRIAKFVLHCALFGLAHFASAAYAEIQVQWLGHGTARIVTEDDKVIILDPYFSSNPKAPPGFQDPDEIGPVDLILVTHGHVDHIGDLAPLAARTGARVIGPYELVRNMVALGALQAEQIVFLGKGGYVEPLGRGLKIHMVRAEHSSSIDLKARDLRNRMSEPLQHINGGEPVGYVIEFGEEFTIYLSGDTGLFSDMRLIGEFFEPDLALICIGGTFTMGPGAAAYALNEMIKPRYAIPIHYGTYPIINRTPAELIDALGDSAVEVLALEPGEVRSFP